MNEKLRVKPVLVGWLVSFFGGMVAGIGIAVYTTGGDLAKLQTFAQDATMMTHMASVLVGALFSLAGGYVAARMAPYDRFRHTKRLGLVVVVVSVPLVLLGAVTQGFGTQTLMGLVSTAAAYGAVLLGGYLGTDDEAAA